ncbi:MAG: DUF3955 domain-containing protein [Candidatus Gracilibacteria bacterium]|nr:DUF3955 domain-containing protein [Candidatus Gracilibacteria bacterium]
MKKHYLFAIIPFLLGIGCVIAYKINGQYIAPDGALVESFGFIPLAYLFFLVGIIASIIIFIRAIIKKK